MVSRGGVFMFRAALVAGCIATCGLSMASHASAHGASATVQADDEDEQPSFLSEWGVVLGLIGGSLLLSIGGFVVMGGKTGPGNVFNRGHSSVYVQTRNHGGGGGGRSGSADE